MTLFSNLIDRILDRLRNRKPKTLTLQQVHEAGNTPPALSEDYSESLNLLDNVVRECITVSRQYAGIASPTPKHFYASLLFTSLISRGISLSILAPHSPWAQKLIEHWDYASAAVITRTMIELRCAFHYLCIDNCTEEEWQCRWVLLNLHDCVSRKRLFEARGDHPKEAPQFELQAEELRNQLKSNSHFSQLSNQKKLLNGQTAYLIPIEGMAENAGIDKNTYRFLHIMFSSHVHGLPMSYFRMGEQERGRGLPSPVEEGYTSMCLTLAASLLAGTRDEAHTLFRDISAVRKQES
jgi:hypothetical protein